MDKKNLTSGSNIRPSNRMLSFGDNQQCSGIQCVIRKRKLVRSDNSGVKQAVSGRLSKQQRNAVSKEMKSAYTESI
jgi:hypothetical protein